MYFLCTIQPNLEETQKADYLGEWMTVEEKRQAIDKFHRLRQAIPITIAHTAPKEFGSGVPHKDKAGVVLDLLCDCDGDLVAKCMVPRDSPAFNALHHGTHLNGEVWGVSPRIDWCALGGEDSPYRIVKTLTHVALTLTPAMADKGTFIHHWAANEAAIDATIGREYYTEGRGQCYAGERLRGRLRELNGTINFVSLSRTHRLPVIPCRSRSFTSGKQRQSSSRDSTLSMGDTATIPNTNNNNNNNNNGAAATGSTLPAAATGSLPNACAQPNGQQQQQQQQPSPQQTPANKEGPSVETRQGRKTMDQLVAEMKELDDLIVDVPLQKMGPEFVQRWLGKSAELKAYKDELESFINSMVDKNRLSSKDALPYINMIRCSGEVITPEAAELKRPLFGFVEASFADKLHADEENRKSFELMKKRNEIFVQENERLNGELESAKKRVRPNEYTTDVAQTPSIKSNPFFQPPVDPYASLGNAQGAQQPPQSFNLMDSARHLQSFRNNGPVTEDTYTRREPVSVHMRAQYDWNVNNDLQATQQKEAESFARLLNAVDKFM